MGAWTVSETIPELSPPNGDFHTISISDVLNPKMGDANTDVTDPNAEEPATPAAGGLVSVADVEVFQDEPVTDFAPDAKVIQATETTYIRVRSQRDEPGNGRVYHISFTDTVGVRYTFKVVVPTETLADDQVTISVDVGASDPRQLWLSPHRR